VILSAAIAGSCGLVSVLQGIFFAFQGPLTVYNLVAICLSVASLFVSWKSLVNFSLAFLTLAVILWCAQLGIFVVNLVGAEPPLDFRLLQVAIALSHAATVMAILFSGVRILTPLHAFMVSFSVAMGFFLGEIAEEMASLFSERPDESATVEWSGNVPSHPLLGQYYAPYSVVKTYYPGNPRGYFEEEDPRESRWRLVVDQDNRASLMFPRENPDMVRIAITKATSETPWHIQLNQKRFSLKSNHRYAMVFQARADARRRVGVAVSKAYAPWNDLGLHTEVELTPQWQSFGIDFMATMDDDNARVHFDVGGSKISVDLASVSLRSLPDGRTIEPTVPKRYVVSYRFNALGCRGRDYSVPRPRSVVRILLLGDSYTLGVGVNEEDTFARQLEILLNQLASQRSSGNYEVINCGVSGYGTREERLFYETLAPMYEPDVVLLVMVHNDNRSWVDDVKMGYAKRRPDKLEQLSVVWSRIQDYRYEPPFPDYSGSLEEIIKLSRSVRNRGARLAVVIFRNNPMARERDNALVKTIKEGLRDTDVSVLDFRELDEDPSERDFFVYRENMLDLHPNETAHQIASRAMLRFLAQQRVVNF
jgi:hypothetical protein